jgi:hypothetical protein
MRRRDRRVAGSASAPRAYVEGGAVPLARDRHSSVSSSPLESGKSRCEQLSAKAYTSSIDAGQAHARSGSASTPSTPPSGSSRKGGAPSRIPPSQRPPACRTAWPRSRGPAPADLRQLSWSSTSPKKPKITSRIASGSGCRGSGGRRSPPRRAARRWRRASSARRPRRSPGSGASRPAPRRQEQVAVRLVRVRPLRLRMHPDHPAEDRATLVRSAPLKSRLLEACGAM